MRTVIGSRQLFGLAVFIVVASGLAVAGRSLAAGQPGKVLTALGGHTGTVHAVAFSPDGKLLASTGGETKIWNLSTGDCVATVHGAFSIAFSPNGKLLAADGWLCDAATGKTVAECHEGRPIRVAFSPDGKLLATGCLDGTTRLWDTASGKKIAELVGPMAAGFVKFSKDGKTLAVANSPGYASGPEFPPEAPRTAPPSNPGPGQDGTNLWDVASGKLLKTIPLRDKTIPSGYEYLWANSPDGKTLVTFSDRMDLQSTNVTTGKAIATFEAAGWVGKLTDFGPRAFSPDGTVFAMSYYIVDAKRSQIQFWNTATGKSIATWENTGADALAFSPDGKTLAGGVDKDVRLWDAVSGKLAGEFAGQSGDVRCLQFSPDGKTLATGDGEKLVHLWDIAAGKSRAALAGHTGAIRCIGFSPDGKMLASGSEDATIRIWNVAKRKCDHVLTGHTAAVASISFSPDGKTLASGSRDATVKLWDLATGKNSRSFAQNGAVLSVAFSSDGETIACGGADAGIRLCDAATGTDKMLGDEKDWRKGVAALAFSPDGKLLASGDAAANTVLWDVATGTNSLISKAGDWRAQRGDSISLAFSDDGKLLAAGCRDDTLVRICDVAKHAEVATIRPNCGGAASVSFSPDAKTLAVCGQSGFELWKMDDVIKGPALKADASSR